VAGFFGAPRHERWWDRVQTESEKRVTVEEMGKIWDEAVLSRNHYEKILVDDVISERNAPTIRWMPGRLPRGSSWSFKDFTGNRPVRYYRLTR
jgi:hypothetical protein